MKKSIQSKKEIVLDLRSGEKGIVNIGFSNISFNQEHQYFKVQVIDFINKTRIVAKASEHEGLEEDVVEPYKDIMNKKTIHLQSSEADELYNNAVASGLAIGQSFTEFFNDLIMTAIYQDTITNKGTNDQLIYNTLPEDWELI